MSARRVIGYALLLLVAIALIGFVASSKLYITALWFTGLGYSRLLWTPMAAKWALAAISFVFSAAFLGYFWGTMRLESETVPFRILKPAAVLIGSLMLSSWLKDHWSDVLVFLNQTPFGVKDPVFHRDVAWYVFTYPLYSVFTSWLLSLTVFAIVGCVVLSQLDWRRALPAGRLSVLGSLLLSLTVVRILLSTAGLVYSPRGTAFGASFTDVNAQIPANYAYIVVLVVLAVYLGVNAFKKHIRAVATAATLAVVLWIAILGVYPAVYQKLIVAPNELAKETPYLRHNIAMTRKGYGLDTVEEHEFTVKELTAQSLESDPEVVNNIRLLDWRPAKSVYEQLQELRPYYAFNDLDVDRYNIGGKQRQVVLSVRELDSSRLPQQAKSWVNERLKYTHGYGFVMSPVNEITSDGQPTFIVKDFPPQGLKVKQPRIYVGELSNSYAFVHTTTQEFDYPKGDSNQYYDYNGKDGVRIGSGLRRLAFGLNYGITKILLSSYLTPDSRILLNRRVQGRVRTLMPFIEWGDDVYPIFANGRIYWLVEGFTSTSRFPFSEPLSTQLPGASNLNYIRNSVKAVVDAYDGTVDFYADKSEPMAASYAKAFPVFKDFKEMPTAIRRHLRYAEPLFEIQSTMFRSYHMLDPQVFFNKEDQWNVPQEISAQSGARQTAQAPYYVINRLRDSDKLEFVIMRAYTPISKENMVAWMAGRCDGVNYGRLILYKFSKETLVYGPMQVEAKVDQDTELSQDLTLWNQQGSTVLRGNTLAYPFGESVMYVQPIYLQAEQGKIPELKKIVTFANGRLGVGTSFSESLSDLLGTAIPSRGQTEPGATGGQGVKGGAPAAVPTVLVGSALESLNKAQEYAGKGDWQAFGSELSRLSSLLQKLQAQSPR